MSDLNRSVFELLFRFAHRSFLFDDAIYFLAAYLPALLVIVCLIRIFGESGWRRRAFFFGEMLLTAILARGIVKEVIAFFYASPRPPGVLGIEPLIATVGSSFPSGHATLLFALAATIFLWDRRWGTWLLAGAFVNSVFRVMAGVHWPLDIVGGAAVGILSALLIHRALAREKSLLDNKGIS